MGFFVMIFSMLIGIVLIVSGTFHRKKNKLWNYAILSGIILVMFAVWLGLPK